MVEESHQWGNVGVRGELEEGEPCEPVQARIFPWKLYVLTKSVKGKVTWNVGRELINARISWKFNPLKQVRTVELKKKHVPQSSRRGSH